MTEATLRTETQAMVEALEFPVGHIREAASTLFKVADGYKDADPELLEALTFIGRSILDEVGIIEEYIGLPARNAKLAGE